MSELEVFEISAVNLVTKLTPGEAVTRIEIIKSTGLGRMQVALANQSVSKGLNYHRYLNADERAELVMLRTGLSLVAN